MGFDSFGMHSMTRMFPIMFFSVFFLVFGFFAFAIITVMRSHRKNNNAPRLTVGAKVVDKRQVHSRGGKDHMGRIWYYVTFEVESGDRLELETGEGEYGLLASGDAGMLTFQGTRFLKFERI